MLPDISHISNRQFKIRDFEEDRVATLKANPGLRYDGKFNGVYRFSGSFYLTDQDGKLIEAFGIIILIGKNYPNAFPLVFSVDGKIDKSDDFHISAEGVICVEHTYIANQLANSGLRLFDFIQYYFPKYFSWVLLKQYGNTENLEEWSHQDQGTIEVYEHLLKTTDKTVIKRFLMGFLEVKKISRNDQCYCGSSKKLKKCHYNAAIFLRSTEKKSISNDIALFL